MRRAPPRTAWRNAGFSLMEAIVAMVLIAGAGMALFAWINGSIASLASLQEANQRSDATVNILEYMDGVNPMMAPEGTATLGSYSIRWRSEPVAPPVDGVNYPRGKSLYQLALYRVDVSVLAEDGQRWFGLQLRQVGYRRTREPPQP